MKRRTKTWRQVVARVNKEKHETPFFNYWKLIAPDLPVPERDYKFVPGRRFALDFAWAELRIGVELHGGGGRGRHVSVKGQAADCEKMNFAAMLGWRVLQFNVVRLKDMAGVVDEVAALVRGERAA